MSGLPPYRPVKRGALLLHIDNLPIRQLKQLSDVVCRVRVVRQDVVDLDFQILRRRPYKLASDGLIVLSTLLI